MISATAPVNEPAESTCTVFPFNWRDHPITGLGRGNFRVFDDGVARAITSFAMEDEPVAIGLIFDHSGSVAVISRDEAETTRLFLKTSNPEDEYLGAGLHVPSALSYD
jgi:Ca-activated chloride channel family protein